MSGSLERFLLDHGETVVRLAPQLMAGARQGMRERGKSDPIDALAIARAALREGLETLPTARLAGPELEIRLLACIASGSCGTRTRLINELRWQLHDLWPDWRCRQARADPSRLAGQGRPPPERALSRQVRVRIARDMIRRVRELTRTINELYQQLAALVAQVAPQLLAEKGIGVLIAAKLIGEIAGIDRFQTDAQLARLAGCAPIPVSSGRTDRYRLDPGGNRQLNHAFHMLALTRISHDPQTARLHRQTTRQRQDQHAKRSAASNATSSAASTTSSATQPRSPPPSA